MAVETELASVLGSRVGLISEIGNHLLGAGGKRLRPALYFLCAKSASSPKDYKLPLAVAIELIHMATLVHDDVIDNSATRRGLPTANVKWGNHTAVLAGDFLFAKAFSLIAATGDNQSLKALTDAICVMCEGELRQGRELFNPDITETDYLERIGKKTAEFIGVSCKLGAMSAGLDYGDAELFYNYGYSLGLAFQITDDILDITASMEQLGKPTGNDLRQGILTLPVIYALQQGARKSELRELILAKDMSELNLARSMATVHETDAVEYSYRRVREYLDVARSSMPASIVPEIRNSFVEVADFVGLRKF